MKGKTGKLLRKNSSGNWSYPFWWRWFCFWYWTLPCLFCPFSENWDLCDVVKFRCIQKIFI